ncbi:MAG: heparan-alpha-glucosaminide N-acetyltransferase [Pararhodobacter sp.]
MTDRMQTPPSPRLPGIDIARGIALIGMVIFHFTFDLEFFGRIGPGTVTSLPWRTFARLVAGSFVFLAGVSLVLAARGGMRWPKFWRDTGLVAAAALGVSVVTWFALGPAWVFFGILHMIVAGRLLGLAFLRLPGLALIVLGVVVWALPYLVYSPVFDTRWLAWIGFAETSPLSMDLEPIFPWFGPFLLGMAFAKLFLLVRNSGGDGGPVGRALAWAGRHSLAIYLIHQPVLMGGMFLLFR